MKSILIHTCMTFHPHDECSLAQTEIHSSVIVGSKGQIVIPKDVRDKLSIKSGDTLTVITKGGIAIGLIKNSDLPDLLSYLQNEIHD